MPTPRRVPAIWLVLLSMVSVQSGSAFARHLFDIVHPVSVTWLRVTTAALVLWAVVRPWRSLRGITRRRVGLIAGFTLCLLGMNVTIYLAFQYIPMGMAVTLEFLGPLSVAVFGSRRARDLLWAVLAAAGVMLLGFSPGNLDWRGVALALVAAACWGGYILVGVRMGDQWRGVDAVAIACMVGAVSLAPVAVSEAPRFTGVVLFTGLAVGVMSTVIPYSLELHAMTRIPPATFGILMSLEPAIAALAALVILGETLGPLDLVAMGCVITASMGSAWSARRGREAAAACQTAG